MIRFNQLLKSGGLECTHSLVLETKNGEWEIQKTGDGFDLHYVFDTTVPGEDDNVEIAFYLNDSSANNLLIGGGRATVFHVDENVQILSQPIEIQIRFFPECPEGRWLGHLSKANRSFQKHKENPYECFDWKIGLRTLQRPAVTSMKIQLRITPAL